MEEALHNLLFRQSSEYLSGVEAVRAVFVDIKQHQQNLLAAMRTAVGDYMARLEPEEIEHKLSNGKRGGLMNAANKLKYWDFYKDLYQVVMQGPAGELPQQMIEQITSARTWELLEVVKKKLGTAFSPETCSGGVVLTGGTAKLAGIADVAAKVFGVPAHLGETPAWVSENMRDPGYHTALGLLYYGVSSSAERATASRRSGGFLTNVKRLFANA